MKARHRPLRSKLDRALQKAHEAGKLQWFNQAFAEQRRLNPVLNYRTARVRLRNVIMKRLLRCQPMTVESLTAEIFRAPSAGVGSPAAPNEKTG